MPEKGLSPKFFFRIKFVENYLFLKLYVTPEGVVFHNVLYYQQLSFDCYQEICYANNTF